MLNVELWRSICIILVYIVIFTVYITIMNVDKHINRLLAELLPQPSVRRIVVLTGARQTGKTTLAKQLFTDLNYINLDAPENRDALRSLSTFAWAKTVGNAVIDEAQKVPIIFEKVKYAYDEAGITFTVLTGSSQLLLLKKIRESLAGRAFFYELWPLMQCELNTPSGSADASFPLLDTLLTERSVSSVLTDLAPMRLGSQSYASQAAEDYILKWGGMPALLNLSESDRWQWLKNYEYTYLERDLADLAKLDDLMPFRKFQQISALRSAQLLNYSELARDTGISVDTARRYLEYLRLSYQAVLLQPYYRNLTSSVVKTPKLYWMDIGLWRHLTGVKGDLSGQLYETMVVAEIVKWVRTRQRDVNVYFYRTRSGNEVDLILETSSGIIGVEIKSRTVVVPKDIRPLRMVAEQLGERWCGGMVVYSGDEIKRLGDPDIFAIPSKRLLQAAAP
ncbi:MAG: ATP-binding protein [Deltaproteobacteria bacterium]|nr:ATP-binding protein [Deltaproteobacteria bacterium]